MPKAPLPVWITALAATAASCYTLGGCAARKVNEYKKMQEFYTKAEPAYEDYIQNWKPAVDRNLDLLTKLMCILVEERNIVVPECRQMLKEAKKNAKP